MKQNKFIKFFKHKELNNAQHKRYISFVLFAIFIINAFSIYTINSYSQNSNILTEAYYKGAANDNLNENVTTIIGDYCSLNDDDMKKVNCVNEYLLFNSDAFKYIITKHIIASDDLIKQGGDCKSWTAFYSAIFTYMGFETNMIYIDNHVYLNVFNDDFYCNVDQLHMECYEFK